MKKLIMFAFIGILLVGLASALFETTIEIEKPIGLEISESAMKYPAISIEDNLGLPLISSVKADLVLTKHDESCGIDCMSEFQIVTYEESSLIDDVKFYRLDEGKTEERSIRSYQFQYYGDVTDYVEECSPAKLTEEELKNETKPYDVCVQVESGSHKDWVNYNIGDVLPAGTYDVKLLGQKAPYMSIDWVMKTQGKMITDWATWGGDGVVTTTYDNIGTGPENGGVNFTSSVSSNFILVTKYSSVTATRALLINSTGSTVATASFVGDVANISYSIQAGKSYLVLADKSGASYNYYTKISVLPKTSGSFTFTNGIFNSVNYTASPSTAFNIVSVSMTNAVVTLNSPADSSIFASANNRFNASANVTNGANLTNISLWTNITGTWAVSNTTNLGGTSRNYTQTWNLTIPTGSTKWNVRACDTDGACGFATSNYTISLDNTAPTITAVTNGTILYAEGDKILLNTTVTDTNLDKVWYSYNGTNTTINGALTGVLNQTTITTKLSSLQIIVYANDSLGNRATPVILTLTLDATVPTITINAGNGTKNYGSLLTNHTLNYTITDTNLDKCWIYYDNRDIVGKTGGIQNFSKIGNGFTVVDLYTTALGGSTYRGNYSVNSGCKNNDRIILFGNSTGVFCNGASTNYTIYSGDAHLGVSALTKLYNEIPCTSGRVNTTNFTLQLGLYNATIYANDTVGNINATTFNWDYVIFENGLTYNATSTTSAIENFISNVTTNGIGITSAYFNYNGLTPKLMSLTNTEGYNYVINTTQIMPSNGTYSFFITYNLANGTQVNSTNYSQTVNSIIPITVSSSCGAGLVPAINFTSYWEGNLSAINMSTVTYNLQYGLSGNTTGTIANGTLNDISAFSICVNNSAPTYSIGYGEVQYSVNGAVDRRYYLFSGTRIVNTTVAIPIYALETSKATSFLVTAETTALQPYDGYYVGLLRWYPASTSYKIVDMGKTDDNGQTVLRVKTEDVDYRLGLYQSDGTLIKLLSPIRMICQTSPCTYTLFADSESTDLTVWNNIQRSLTFDETTKIFTFTWNDPSQVSQTINLTVYKDTATSSDIVCTSSSSGYTGILTCDVSAYSGSLRAEVFRTASPTTSMATLRAEIRQLFSSVGGGSIGLFIGIILLIFFALIGTFSPVTVVILGMVALIPLWLLGSINIAVMTGIGVIGGVVLHFMKRVS